MITDGAKGLFNVVQYLDVIEYCSKYSKLETKVEKKLLRYMHNPSHTYILLIFVIFIER